MTHGFLETRALPDSALRRTDALWKLLLVSSATVLVASEPRGELRTAVFYALLIAALALLGRVRLGPWLGRLSAVVPFLALASALPFAAGAAGGDGARWAASILLRGLLSAALLSWLVETTELHEIIRALERLRLPGAWIAAFALAYRYVFLLADEWTRTGQARLCRAPELAGVGLAGAMSQQLGLIFVRAWERGERIHAAMLARGFNGAWPVDDGPARSARGAFTCWLFAAAFLAVRTIV